MVMRRYVDYQKINSLLLVVFLFKGFQYFDTPPDYLRGPVSLCEHICLTLTSV